MILLFSLAILSAAILMVMLVLYDVFDTLSHKCSVEDYDEDMPPTYRQYTKERQILYDLRVVFTALTVLFLAATVARYFNNPYPASLAIGLLSGLIVWSVISIARIHKWRLIY